MPELARARDHGDPLSAIAVKDGARVRLASRNQKELTRDYPTVVAAPCRATGNLALV